MLAVVFALWLNLAVQPCAMAFSDGDHDCPHCPPAQEEMAAHHGHHGDESRTGCDSLPADCGEIDDFSLDGRTSQGKLKAKADTTAIVASVVPEAIPDSIGLWTTSADPPESTTAPPPIHLLNCVFLN